MRRRGGSVIEVALFVPVLFVLLVGMEQLGKLTYTYFTLRKSMYTLARFIAVQQGVNFCDDADTAIAAAKNFAVSGTSTDPGSDPVLPGLTTEMLTVSAERADSQSGAVIACDCSVTGCDAAAGGGPPQFVVVTIPDGYEVTPRIPFLTIDPIPLRPTVRVPFGGT